MPFEASLNLKAETLTLFITSAVICMSDSPEPHISWPPSSNFPCHLFPCSLLFSLWGLKLFLFNFYLLSPLSLLFPIAESAGSPPPLLLKSLRMSASWLCLSLISFCQAFVFDHRSSVSSLLLLLSTSFSPPWHFWLPIRTGLWVCVCTCVRVCACARFWCIVQNLSLRASLLMGEWGCVCCVCA